MAVDNSLILRSPATPTYAPRPRAYRDPMVRPGTKFLFDLTRPTTHPDGVITPGVVTNAQIEDLSGNDVSFAVPGGSWEFTADGSLKSNNASNPITIGTAGQFDMSVDPYDFVAIVWFNSGSSFPASGNNYLFDLQGTTILNGLFSLLTASTDGMKADVRATNATGAGAFGSPLSRNAPHMLAIHRSFTDGTVTGYVDGLPIWSISATALPTATTHPVRLRGAVDRRVYRCSLVDIQASIAAETEQGYAEAMRLNAADHILREWQFCTGQVAQAPRDAFA